MHSKILASTFCLLLSAVVGAEPAAAPTSPVATDPAYRLLAGDRILVSIFGEGDLAASQMLDTGGSVRLPLLGSLALAGHTVREAEGLIENAYRRQEILRQPQVTLSVGTYAPREVTILGAVRSPGTFQFPPDATSLDIRDVVARQGGFTPVAKGDSVTVTRREADGREITRTINVARMMSSRARTSEDLFLVLPGDRLFVPERLF